MIAVKDRIPVNPNRKKITYEDDSSVRYAVVEYADNPVEVGTPINRALFQSLLVGDIGDLKMSVLKMMLQLALATTTIDAWADLLADTSLIDTPNSSACVITGGVINAKLGTITTGGTPISGGDNGTSYSKDKAFDNNEATTWGSSQSNTTVNGNAYIGYNFGSAKTINKIAYKNNDSTSAVTSVKVQKSSDGTTWTTIATSAVSSASNAVNMIAFADQTAQYFRILANSAPTGGTYYWLVQEVYMSAVSVVRWNPVTPTEALAYMAVVADQTPNAGTITWYLSDDGTNWVQVTALDTVQIVSFDAVYVYLKCVLTVDAVVSAVAWGGY